jgi:cytoskeletal protein CcmA (bactofilin family)
MDNQTDLDKTDGNGMSVIGSGITITGNIVASVDLQLLGAVHGDVKCATLLMAEGSLIRGSIHAERVRVSGTVEGSVETQDLAVESMARINGDVTYSRIRIANGGIVDGKMSYRPAEGADGGKLRLVGPAPATKAKGEPLHIE